MGMPPGYCADCCACPTPAFYEAQRGASKSKSACGSVNSADGKTYRTITTTTEVNFSLVDGPEGGCFDIDPDGGQPYNSHMTETASYGTVTNYDATTCASTSSCFGTWACSYGGCTTSGTLGADCVWSGTNDYGSAVIPFTGPGDDCYQRNPTPYAGTLCSISGSSGTTTSYTNEYTTANVEAAAIGALGTWPALTLSSPGEIASAELATDESSYTIMQGKYQFRHKPSNSGTYKLIWIERFTPDNGTPNVDTAQSYTWDGTTPGGYDPADDTTWPHTGVYEVDQPSSNGSISIVALTVTCDPTS